MNGTVLCAVYLNLVCLIQFGISDFPSHHLMHEPTIKNLMRSFDTGLNKDQTHLIRKAIKNHQKELCEMS
jgi:hypothetical protein